jgi:hypothetical protein
MDSGTLHMFILGGVFIFLGIIGFIWSKKEEGAWFSFISERIDVREFLDHSPGRPEPNALRIGGKIAILAGVVLIIVAAIMITR